MFKIALLLVALFATLAIVHGAGTNSICDRYSAALGLNNTALMTTFVSTAFTRLLNQPITNPYFTGKRGANSTNVTIDYTKDTAAFNGLAAGLIAFFGGALGCSDAGFPVYTGDSSMTNVHKNNLIDRAAFEVFNQLLVNVAQVFGFNHTDYDALATVLESFREEICTQSDCFTGPHTIVVGNGDGKTGLWYTPAAGYSFPAGTSITWIWPAANSSLHSVTQSASFGACTPLSGGFSSGSLNGNGAAKNFTQTFNTAGQYFYYCAVSNHCAQGMYGTFNITAAATTAASTATTAASTATTAATTATTAASTATTAATTATTAASTATNAATSLTTRGGSSGAATVFVSMALLAVALLF